MRQFDAIPMIVLLILTTCLVSLFAACGQTVFNPLSEVRTFGNQNPLLGEPFGIALKGGEIFVSDGLNGVIWRVDAAGIAQKFASGLSTPSHLAFSGNGDLYVADSGSHTIRVIAADGVVKTFAGVDGKSGFKDGPTKEALFNGPIGIVESNGKLFVSDSYNDRIRIIENGKVTTLAGGETGFADSAKGVETKFNTPTGLAISGDKIIVADTGNRRIRVIEADGKTWTLAGSGNAGAVNGLLAESQFVMPVGVAVDTHGSLYVADGDKIRVIGRRLVPIVETIGGGERGFGDGKSRRAQFNRASGLAFSKDGDLFIADSDNALVRVMTNAAIGKPLSKSEFTKSRISPEKFRSASARWPFSPPGRPREIAGTVGEIRGEAKKFGGDPRFHNGLDIVGGYAEEVKVIRTEKVLRPLSVSDFANSRESIRFPDIGYVHLRIGRNGDSEVFKDQRFQFRFKNDKPTGLRVPRGSVFKEGDVLGTLNSMYHVHLIAGAAGRERNALNALKLPGISDSKAPVIENVELTDEKWVSFEPEGDEVPVSKKRNIRIIASAYDQMDGNADRRRLGLYKLGYQLFDDQNKPQEGFAAPKWTIIFEKTPSNSVIGFVYANGSRSGAKGTTEFRYIVTNTVSGSESKEGFLDLSGFKAGKYILRVFAADFFGNTASKDVLLKIS